VIARCLGLRLLSPSGSRLRGRQVLAHLLCGFVRLDAQPVSLAGALIVQRS
jgi:hypothetical protein